MRRRNVRRKPGRLFDHPRGALAVIIVYGLIVAWGWSRREDRGGHPADRLLHRVILLYYTVMTLVMAVFDPATQNPK